MTKARLLDVNGRAVTLEGSFTVTYPVIIGATASPSTTAAMVAAWPNCGYSREYGKDGPDADTLTDLTPDNTNKYAVSSFHGYWHTSYKDDPADVVSYRFDDARYWSWHHESADEMTGAQWLAGAVPLAQNLAVHPDAGNVLGTGPCLTNWQIRKDNPKRLDPATYWDDIFSFFSADSYNQKTNGYADPEIMFGSIRDVARGFGVPWLVPEWGGERVSGDTSGTSRAAWIRDCVAFLREQGDCIAVGWWDIGGCRVSHQSGWPEFAALRDAMTLP